MSRKTPRRGKEASGLEHFKNRLVDDLSEEEFCVCFQIPNSVDIQFNPIC